MKSQLRSYLHSLFTRDQVESSIEAEIRSHIELRAKDLEHTGLPPAEALRQARIEFGGIETHKADIRSSIGLRLFDELRGDIRYGLRGLWRSPGFATIAILSLALSIGTATTMFSVVHAVLLDVYPYAGHERTVNPIVHDPTHPEDWDWFVMNRDQYNQYKSAPPFEEVFGTVEIHSQLDEDDAQETLHATLLTANASHFYKYVLCSAEDYRPPTETMETRLPISSCSVTSSG